MQEKVCKDWYHIESNKVIMQLLSKYIHTYSDIYLRFFRSIKSLHQQPKVDEGIKYKNFKFD